jgi:hypothetical protein
VTELGDLFFDGDPETDSTRRRLERVMKEKPARVRWPWKTALIAGSSVFMFWQLNRRRSRRNGDGNPGKPGDPSRTEH